MAEPPIKAAILPVTPFQQNSSLVWCTRTMKGAVVDPGGDVGRLQQLISAQKVSVEKVLLTHGHLDHAGGAAALARALGVPIEGPHTDDLFLLESLAEQGKRYGFQGSEPCVPDALARRRRHGDGRRSGSGRAPLPRTHAGPCRVLPRRRAAGVRRRRAVPRLDRAHRFSARQSRRSVKSITERLWPLGDDMNFVPGHGQMSTFGWERKTNPYVSDLALGRA